MVPLRLLVVQNGSTGCKQPVRINACDLILEQYTYLTVRKLIATEFALDGVANQRLFDCPLGLKVLAFLAAITGAGIRLSEVADHWQVKYFQVRSGQFGLGCASHCLYLPRSQVGVFQPGVF